MAKQCGPIFLTGSMSNLCFYKMRGRYYIREKSSLSRERVKNSPSFRRTRENAAYLASASRLASGIYQELAPEDRKIRLFRQITGKIYQLLCKGIKEDRALQEVKNMLAFGSSKNVRQER